MVQRGSVGSMVRRVRIGFATGSGELYRPLCAAINKLRNVAVEFAFLSECSFPVVASFSQSPHRQAHREVQVSCERSRPP